MKKFLLCLDEIYNIPVSDDLNFRCMDYENIIDTLTYLLKQYMIDDDEIIETLKNEIGIDEITKNED